MIKTNSLIYKTYTMEKIEHIGIAVKDLDISIPLFEQLLNTSCYKIEEVESEGVQTAFFATGPNKIELVASTKEDSPIAKFIERKGEGIHHIAFKTQDIRKEMERLAAAGFQLLNDVPKKGADGQLVCFLHPKSSNGVLIELCQDDPDFKA